MAKHTAVRVVVLESIPPEAKHVLSLVRLIVGNCLKCLLHGMVVHGHEARSELIISFRLHKTEL